jgi:hypothetical protein
MKSQKFKKRFLVNDGVDCRVLRCSICDLLMSDPDKLREHRLSKHKSVYLEKICLSLR